MSDPRPHVLREYALLADGERGAVVGPEGHVVWLCSPTWDADPVFCSLLGGHGGYQVVPADPWSVWSGRYEPGTLIWHSRWATTDTIVRCREALAMPADPHTTVLLRRVSADDPTRITAVLTPPGRGTVRELRRAGDVWTCRVDGAYLRWSGAVDAVPDGDRLVVEAVLGAGAHRDFVLEISDHPPSPARIDPDHAWRVTEQAWASAVPDFPDTLAPGDVAHSYAVLHGLTSASGAMVAAATTGLPEREQSTGNYDYRYTWIRDQCWVGQAIAANGPHPLLDRAVSFVTERLLDDGPRLRPVYTTAGGLVQPERSLDVTGYPGGGNTVGNRARDQFQLDSFGEALLLFSAAARHDRLTPQTWRAAELAVEAVRARWDEPDEGIWELSARRWTESRLTCVAGLRRAAAVAPRPRATRWRTLADDLLASVTRDHTHPTGRWQRTTDDDRVDASLLLAGLRGAVPAHDPHSVATFTAVREQLTRDGYVYRYRHHDRSLGSAEGAFLVCGFIAALAADQQGDHATALRLFERNRAACGPPGLYAEEYDVPGRQLRGNLPQAFVHGLLVESATRLARSRPGAPGT